MRDTIENIIRTSSIITSISIMDLAHNATWCNSYNSQALYERVLNKLLNW